MDTISAEGNIGKSCSGYSDEWDGRYKAGTHRSVWPWTDLVSLCERHARPRLSSNSNILELGCGCGANISYLSKLGNYYGVDGSETAIRENIARFPHLKDRFRIVDFTNELGFHEEVTFDVICDRGSITHNSNDSIINCVKLINKGLRARGLFIGVMWFSKQNSEYLLGRESTDIHTRSGYTSGPYANTGNVHFSDDENLKMILSGFDVLYLEHKLTRVIVPEGGSVDAFYNFVAQKPA